MMPWQAAQLGAEQDEEERLTRPQEIPTDL
jgi:hypothetical protein